MIDLRWQVGAACSDEETADFYLLPDDPAHRETIERLKKVCATCAVFEACRSYALEYETHGFWAGMTVSERRRVRGQEGIARKTPGAPLSIIEGRDDLLRTPTKRRHTLRRTPRR